MTALRSKLLASPPRTLCLALALGLLTALGAPSSAVADDAAELTVQVRDVYTGVAVPAARGAATDAVTGLVTAESRADDAGRLEVDGALDRVEISAPGYEPLAIRPALRPADQTSTTVWLRPRRLPNALNPETLAARSQPHTTLLHGHVVDARTARPVDDATVRVVGTETVATTDGEGYFFLHAKGTRVTDPTDRPEIASLLVEKPGYSRVRLADVALFNEDVHFIVDLERGSGEVVRDMSHKMFPKGVPLAEAAPRDPEAAAGVSATSPLVDAGSAPATLGVIGLGGAAAPEDDGVTSVTAAATKGGLQLVNPPDQIYVSGYGWYPLEVYVARGLCSEWISSWPQESLDAGSIAYRSYGTAYYQTYGYVCATTSCQVFQNTYVSKCDQAAQTTSGILLERGGSVAFSEYSAENNSYYCSSYSCVNYDRSCGYGYAGSPAYGWPCLSDSHSFSAGPGPCCFGHGRGMCQWGTRAWAYSGWLWNRMVDHYYNASGSGSGDRTMEMTTPLDLVSASPSPSSVARGGSFTISATVRSYTDYGHDDLLLGASILGPSSISDPPHDKAFTALARTSFSVQSRDTGVSRSFDVPSYAPTGYYDLVVAIWYDTDGNGQITSADKALRTFRENNAVYVY